MIIRVIANRMTSLRNLPQPAHIRLLQHAPRRVVGLEGYGLEIVEQVQV